MHDVERVIAGVAAPRPEDIISREASHASNVSGLTPSNAAAPFRPGTERQISRPRIHDPSVATWCQRCPVAPSTSVTREKSLPLSIALCPCRSSMGL
jgi:hypothetical protein